MKKPCISSHLRKQVAFVVNVGSFERIKVNGSEEDNCNNHFGGVCRLRGVCIPVFTIGADVWIKWGGHAEDIHNCKRFR